MLVAFFYYNNQSYTVCAIIILLILISNVGISQIDFNNIKNITDPQFFTNLKEYLKIPNEEEIPYNLDLLDHEIQDIENTINDDNDQLKKVKEDDGTINLESINIDISDIKNMNSPKSQDNSNSNINENKSLLSQQGVVDDTKSTNINSLKTIGTDTINNNDQISELLKD